MKRPTFSKIGHHNCLYSWAFSLFAQNFVPFTPRFDQELKGDMLLIGNSNVGPDSDPFNDSQV